MLIILPSSVSQIEEEDIHLQMQMMLVISVTN